MGLGGPADREIVHSHDFNRYLTVRVLLRGSPRQSWVVHNGLVRARYGIAAKMIKTCFAFRSYGRAMLQVVS